MNLERGTVNTFLITAREQEDPAFYLAVFQNVDDPTNYQYCIVENSGSSTGPLMLEILEKDNADAFNAEVTLGAGDWLVSFYEQDNDTNLDASLSSRQIWSEQVTVTSNTEDAPVYPPSPGGAACGPLTILLTVEGQSQAPFVVDTCVDNTVNISVG